MKSRDQNIVRVEKQFLEWTARIEALANRAEAAGESARADYRERIEALKIQQAEAAARLAEFKAAGTETWDAFKLGIEGAWQDLEAAVKDLARDEPNAIPVARAAPRRSRSSRPTARPPIPKAPVRHRSGGR